MGASYRSILCAFALLAVSSVMGQRFAFDFTNVKEGLSDRQVNALSLGPDGFLWVGTRDGLNRFDGRRFLTFSQGGFEEDGLSRGSIVQISPNQEGNLLLFYEDYYGYFDRFSPRDFSLDKIVLNPASGVTGFPRVITTDHLGRVFVVTISRKSTVLYEYTEAGFVLITSLAERRERISTPVRLLSLRNGQFILYDAEVGMRRLSATGELLERFDLSHLSIFRPTNEVAGPLECLRQGPDGKIYFAFRGYPGLYELDLADRSRLSACTQVDKNTYYQWSFVDEIGQLLFLGKKRFGPTGIPDRYYLLNEDGGFEDFSALNRIGRRIFTAAGTDFRKKIYLGLYDGLGIVEWRADNLSTYLDVPQEEEFFQRLVRGITQDPAGNVYFTEQSGELHCIDAATGVSNDLYLHVPANNGELLEIDDVNQLIYDEREHALWASGRSLGGRRAGKLYRYDIEQCTTDVFYHRDGPLTCMLLSESGQLYLGSGGVTSTGNLLFFDREAELFLPVTGPMGNNVMNGAVPTCLAMAPDKRQIYVGTESRGLFLVDPLTGRSSDVSPSGWTENGRSVSDYVINCMYLTPDGSLYLGTRGGVYHYDPKTEALEHFERSDGLSNNIVSAILPGEDESLWISTYNGISHYHPNRVPVFRNYYRTDGLSNDEFNIHSSLLASDGRYYFGGVNGLTAFHPQQLNRRGPPPTVLVSRVILAGAEERQLDTGLNGDREVVVGSDEKGITVYLALPPHVIGERHRIRVMLEGFNKDWIELDDERTVRYNNLNSGRYRLLAQATDANGDYGEAMTVLPFLVRVHFYQERWFIILLALTILGFIVGLLQSKSREKLRNELLRTQLSSDIHDEVSGLLAGITMQSELLQTYTEDEKLKARLRGVGEAGRKAMNKMSDVIWSIDSRRDTTGDLVQRMQEHADDVLLPLEIKYTFRTEGLDNETRQLAGNKRQDIYFIYKEAINNVARHSNASRVHVYLGQTASEFEMIIRNDGISNTDLDERRSAKTGQGLANLRMRADRLDADLILDEKGDNVVVLRMRRL